MKNQLKKVKSLYDKYERKLIPGMLVLGFLVDVFTFKSIDIISTFILLGIHIILLGISIAYINIYDARLSESNKKYLAYLRLVFPLIMQFSLGALLSGTFIFYSFGGALSVTWPLLLVLIFLIVSNELFKLYYLQPVIQSVVYFFVLFTTFSIILPFSFASLSPWIFFIAGILAYLVMFTYIYGLSRLVPVILQKRKRLYAYMGVVFLFMHIFYFLNVVPPIPVSLKDAGVYHSVKRVGVNYNLLQDKESFLQKIIPGKTITILSGEPVYIFTAIFAPANLNTTVVHNWQLFNEENNEWESKSKIVYPIVGGRKAGYRGYTLFPNMSSGKWRVFVETERGQVLGKIPFTVKVKDEKKERIIIKK